MLENEFTSKTDGRNEEASQIKEHLKNISYDELVEKLADSWDTCDDSEFDSDVFDAYLEELEKRCPIGSDIDVDASLTSFYEKHAQLFAHEQPASPVSVKPFRRRSIRMGLVAAVIILVSLLTMMTAQAFGYDVFGAIARWTESTFGFTVNESAPQAWNTPVPAAEGDYSTLQEALDACGITAPIEPQWFPEGTQTISVVLAERMSGAIIQSEYEYDDNHFSITIRDVSESSNAAAEYVVFEKNADEVVSYDIRGIPHYIFSNSVTNQAVWYCDSLMCSISGEIEIDELEKMLDSIYER